MNGLATGGCWPFQSRTWHHMIDWLSELETGLAHLPIKVNGLATGGCWPFQSRTWHHMIDWLSELETGLAHLPIKVNGFATGGCWPFHSRTWHHMIGTVNVRMVWPTWQSVVGCFLLPMSDGWLQPLQPWGPTSKLMLKWFFPTRT